MEPLIFVVTEDAAVSQEITLLLHASGFPCTTLPDVPAALRAIQAQLPEQPGPALFRNGQMTIDFTACRVCIQGKPLPLTPTEYKLLCLFARNVGTVLPHSYLTQHLWGSTLECDIASLRVHMATLRKKVEQQPGAPFFRTHVGTGYQMLQVNT